MDHNVLLLSVVCDTYTVYSYSSPLLEIDVGSAATAGKDVSYFDDSIFMETAPT
jgi:hypothetical protein